MSKAANILKRVLGTLTSVETQEAIKAELETAQLEDGTVIEAESFEIGMTVFVPVEDGEAIAMPAGQYELDNGMTILCDENGVILEVAEAGAEEEAPETPAAPAPEMAGSEKPVNDMAKVKRTIERMEKETVFSAVEVDEKVNAAVQEATEKLQNEHRLALEKVKADNEVLTAQLNEMKLSLSEETVAKPLNRQQKTEFKKLSTAELKSLPTAQRILYKTKLMNQNGK